MQRGLVDRERQEGAALALTLTLKGGAEGLEAGVELGRMDGRDWGYVIGESHLDESLVCSPEQPAYAAE